jgi:hypothetical protein
MLNRINGQEKALAAEQRSQLPTLPGSAPGVGGSMRRDASEPTPLAAFVRQRLEELEMKQSDFCRLTGFDQGLLSKIQNSVITSLSLESTLRLALGLSVSPRVIFGLTDRLDMQDLVMRAYAIDLFPELAEMHGIKIPGSVLEVTRMALCAYSMGRSLAPAYSILNHLIAMRRSAREAISGRAIDGE